jgi:hypothetical protein
MLGQNPDDHPINILKSLSLIITFPQHSMISTVKTASINNPTPISIHINTKLTLLFQSTSIGILSIQIYKMVTIFFNCANIRNNFNISMKICNAIQYKCFKHCFIYTFPSFLTGNELVVKYKCMRSMFSVLHLFYGVYAAINGFV